MQKKKEIEYQKGKNLFFIALTKESLMNPGAERIRAKLTVTKRHIHMLAFVSRRKYRNHKKATQEFVDIVIEQNKGIVEALMNTEGGNEFLKAYLRSIWN